MRFKINLIGNNTIIPNNNQHLVLSYIHKCIGRNNEYHDTHSNYSISTLQGGILDKDNKRVIVNEAYIIISSFDLDFLNKVVCGVMCNNIFHNDIKLKSIEPIDENLYNGHNYFRTLSPILLREGDKCITINDFNDKEEFAEYLKNKTINKLKSINKNLELNLKLDNFDIKIDWCHSIKRFVKPNCRGYFVNNCQMTIIANKKVAELLYNIGLGQSTGAGFGCVYKTENKHIYRNQKNKEILTINA